MPKLIIMVGFPGSGKTEYADKYFPTFVVASQDAIGSTNKFYSIIKTYMDDRYDIVADRCNHTHAHREELIELARREGYWVEIIWIVTPHNLALKRLNERQKHLTIDPDWSSVEKERIYWHFADEFDVPNMDEGVDALEVNGLLSECLKCGESRVPFMGTAHVDLTECNKCERGET